LPVKVEAIGFFQCTTHQPLDLLVAVGKTAGFAQLGIVVFVEWVAKGLMLEAVPTEGHTVVCSHIGVQGTVGVAVG